MPPLSGARSAGYQQAADSFTLAMWPSHPGLQRLEGLAGRARQAESQAVAERQQRQACEAEAESLRQQLRALQQQLSDMQPAVPSGSMVSKRLTAKLLID